MVAVFGWVEYLANATATATPTNLNLGSTTAANLAASTYPITAGTYSYEKWIRGLWTGSFTRIENLKFWMTDTAYVTGETLKMTGFATQYATPITVVSTIATTVMPTSEPSTNVSIGGTTTGSLVATGYSDFIVIQASITTAASAGATNQKTFTLQYDEV